MNMKEQVKYFSENIGERNYNNIEKLRECEDTLLELITNMGYTVKSYPYKIQNHFYHNFEIDIKGESDNIICIGAHYDTIICGGANDNTSGVVGILYLLDQFRNYKPKHTLRFCLFVNEEPPFFDSEWMGSFQYARMCKKRNDNIQLMIALDLIGYYTDEPDTQEYPSTLIYKQFPNVGNFIASISGDYETNIKFRHDFMQSSNFPIQHMTFPMSDFFSYCSDHGSFSKFGYKSILLTDTAFLRYKYYHNTEDTYDKLNYEKMEEFLIGLYNTIKRIDNA